MPQNNIMFIEDIHTESQDHILKSWTDFCNLRTPQEEEIQKYPEKSED